MAKTKKKVVAAREKVSPEPTLIEVIHACEQAGVKEIKWNGLEICFGNKEDVNRGKDVLEYAATHDDGTSTEIKPNDKNQKEQQQEVDLDMLVVTDPYAWEQAELSNDRQ